MADGPRVGALPDRQPHRGAITEGTGQPAHVDGVVLEPLRGRVQITGLTASGEREELVRRPDGSWLLRGDPPDAQTLARRPTAAELRGQDMLRPSRLFARETEDVDPESLIEAMDRLREALDPGELRGRIERRRGATR